MNPDQTALLGEQSDLGIYCLQYYRLPKNIADNKSCDRQWKAGKCQS